MKIVADTNIFIAVALNEPEKEDIIDVTKGQAVAAPEVLPFEIGNALIAMVKRNTLDANQVMTAWNRVRHIPVDLQRTDIPTALNIALQYGLYAYDAYFLACAHNLHSPLLTLDRQMKSIAHKMGIPVMELTQ